MKLTSYIKTDMLSGMVVFLVALPLCLGIAVASGAPPFAGIITGIIGGIVVGSISNSNVSVSGPAAGLIAIILAAITDYLWRPFKWLGNKFAFFQSKAAIVILTLLFLFGVFSNFFPGKIPADLYSYLPLVFSFAGMILILNSFTERRDARKAWISIVAAQLFITLSIALFHEGFGREHVIIFLSGLQLAP